jgi:hypothetical protein
MSDSLKFLGCEITGESSDPKRDRRQIAGTVRFAVTYGDISWEAALAFSGAESVNDAVRDGLRRLENFGHFLEHKAAAAKFEYGVT